VLGGWAPPPGHGRRGITWRGGEGKGEEKRGQRMRAKHTQLYNSALELDSILRRLRN